MNAPTEAQFDTQNLYREETYTDRRVGTLRVMVPVQPLVARSAVSWRMKSRDWV